MRSRVALLVAASSLLLAVAPAGAASRSKLQTPGYKGVRKAPKLLPAAPPTPVALGQGEKPRVVVDEGGTAHVVWNEGRGSDEDVLHYCRLKRGATACDAAQTLVPPLDTSDAGNGPAANADFDGPKVFALGDEVALLTQRSFRTVGPDGKSTQSPTFLYLSQDGGTTFNPPALVGTAPLSGEAAVFGAADAPRIGLISAAETGGPFFQALSAGRYTNVRAALGDPAGNDGLSSSTASVDGRPIVAFENLGGTTTVRLWSGQGDVHDPATWSRATLPGASEPLLASGPAGVFLATADASGPRTYSVRRLTPPDGFGAPVRASAGTNASRRDLAQDGSGRLHLSYRDGDAAVPTLAARASTDGGRTWSAPRVLLTAARDSDIWRTDLGAASDGGGFVVGQIAPGGAEGPIVASAFGARAATGRPGLGALPGGGGDAGVVERCARIEFAAVDIVAPEGCLLSVAGRSGIKASEGTILLNGLELVPDPGVKILIDARSRTIDSTGKVTVQARPPDSDPVVLAKDELHIKLPGEGRKDGSGICKGDSFVGFDAGAAKLKGFPIRGSIEIFLEQDSTCIPVSLELPKVFGGIRGDAVLRASNQRGLHLESLDIRAATIPVGPVLIQDLNIRYARSGTRWTGGARLTFPPGFTLGASVTFSDGSFLGATATVGYYPGVPVFSGVFLNRVTAGFEAEPLKLTAAARFGFVPLAPPDTFTIAVNGSLAATFGNPFELKVRGDVSVFDFSLLQAEATIRSDLYFNVKARLQIDLAVVLVRGDAEIWIDGPRKEFGGSVAATVKVFGFSIGTAEAVLSDTALGICGPTPIPFVEGGFALVWREGVKTLWGDCDLDAYRATPGVSGARASQAGTFTVPANAGYAGLRATGDGGVPSLVLVSPTGERIVPTREGGPGVRAIVADSPEDRRAFVALPKPVAGAWRVEAAPGSPPVTAVEWALAKPAPRVSGQVAPAARRARTRVLRWRFPNAQGRTLSFVEQGAAGTRSLGTGRGTGGATRFSTGEGPAGRRTIYAVVSQDGTPRRRIRLAAYDAPGPPRPARVARATVRRSGRALQVAWSPAPGAARYLVRVTVSDGRRFARLTRGRTLRVGAVGPRDRFTVRVQGRGRNGRLGPARDARRR